MSHTFEYPHEQSKVCYVVARTFGVRLTGGPRTSLSGASYTLHFSPRLTSILSCIVRSEWDEMAGVSFSSSKEMSRSSSGSDFVTVSESSVRATQHRANRSIFPAHSSPPLSSFSRFRLLRVGVCPGVRLLRSLRQVHRRVPGVPPGPSPVHHGLQPGNGSSRSSTAAPPSGRLRVEQLPDAARLPVARLNIILNLRATVTDHLPGFRNHLIIHNQ